MAIKDYLNIITSEHRDKEKFIATTEAFLEKVQDVENCLSSFFDEFSIDSARGAQLDLLGAILNFSRNLIYNDGTVETLDDQTYYELLLSKIARNYWDGSVYGLLNLWSIIFPGFTITVKDNQDMTADVYLYFPVQQKQMTLIQNDLLIPKPIGVKFNYTSIPDVLFSYDKDPSYDDDEITYVSGYDDGEWEIII